ncbi:nicotinate (nicotinamide) nucleotide adenylyltransferase [Pseudocolwellia sp. HL-MZ19]|uniref:nicotinate (nicotinamide) nucleotide adenylyltransferase n=1 Tax=unclassified Pseudocolwellia TaxID=2848178 RepID=UPI003CE94EAA
MTSEHVSSGKKLRIGILGGTFDPIHKGHIEPAKQVFAKFKLDKVLVIPAHKPPHKLGTNASTTHRVNMVELACADEQGFELDTRETKRTSLSYTLDTINEIKVEYPNSELFFIMGMDSLLNFTRWYLWENILEKCNLIVNTRPGYDLSSINAETKALLNKYQSSMSDLQTQTFSADELPINVVSINSANINKAPIKENTFIGKDSGLIFLHNTEELDISSTEIRHHISNQVDCSQWLTSDIIKYIKNNTLYNNI